MRPDIHAAALRAAAKVAFSVAFLGGCGATAQVSGTDPTQPSGAGERGSGAQASESDVTDGTKLVPPRYEDASTNGSRDGSAADASVPKPDSGPLDCDARVTAAFPTPGEYPGEKQEVSNEVRACCAELLTSSDPDKWSEAAQTHRWDCCANFPEDTPSEVVSAACTPWGPPVPPAMRRRGSKTTRPRPDAWTGAFERAVA